MDNQAEENQVIDEVETEDQGSSEMPETDDQEVDTNQENNGTLSDEEDAQDSDDSEESTDISEDNGEVVISFGEEESPPQEREEAPQWVKDLRKENRELKKKLKQEAKAKQEQEPQAVKLPAKPKLSDFDYDSDKYEAELDKWYEVKRDHDKVKAEQDKQQEEVKKAWQGKLDTYGKQRDSLSVVDFEEAEELVQESFNETQQAMIIEGADNSAALFYALGKNPKRLEQLSKIKNPVQFAFAVAKMETELSITRKKPTTKPEKTVKGSGNTSGSLDSRLEKLEAEADRTGDRSKLIAYRRSLKKS